MRPPQATILLTGFGPFPGMPENATASLVPKLAHLAARRFHGHRVVARILPTEWEAAPACLAAAYAREKPKLALHFGVSERARGFAIESAARNARGATPDALGALPASPCVAADGPAELATLVPAATIVARLTVLGLPAHLSDDAGSYLCNAVLYEALLRARNANARTMAGFVHIPPRLPGRGGEPQGPAAVSPLDWESALNGGLEIIRVCLGRPAPARLNRR